MPIINFCQQARSEITSSARLSNNSFAFSTAYHGAKIISIEDCTAQLSFKDENLNFNTSAVCFSPDAQLMAYVTKNYLHVADIQSKKVIKSIYVDKEELNFLTFDLSSQYIVAGTKEGRVLLYKYNSSSQLARLCSFPHQRPKTKLKKNFVSSATFHKNLLAVSGYGGAIFVLDIYSRANKTLLLHGISTKRALHFLNENTIISGDNEGNLQLISIPEDRVVKKITMAFKNIAQIVPIPNTKFLIVHANTNSMLILDSKEYKIVHKNYLEFEDNIDRVESIDAKTLIVCLKNKNILHVELPSRERLSSLILHNSLPEAYKLVEKEYMLQDTLEHKSLEKIYDKTYKKAADALINQNIALANQLTEMYKNVSSKKESIKLLFKSFENYNRFKTLYLEKRYALCYAMSSKFPALKVTNQYERDIYKCAETYTAW